MFTKCSLLVYGYTLLDVINNFFNMCFIFDPSQSTRAEDKNNQPELFFYYERADL